MSKKKGRPPKYKDPAAMQKVIDRYFEECNGEYVYDDNGAVLMDARGSPVVRGAHPPTVTGLALALGFASRKALLGYQGKKEFAHIVMRAKLRVESYLEQCLFDREKAPGAMFSLINNFKWVSCKASTDADATPCVRVIDISGRQDVGENQRIVESLGVKEQSRESN